MCMYEFLFNKLVYPDPCGHCPIESYDCCGISDRDIEVLCDELSKKITQLSLIREKLLEARL